MIDDAIRAALEARGITPTRVDTLGDYTTGTPLSYAVHTEREAGRRRYIARLQLRVRAASKLAAFTAAEAGFSAVLSLRRHVLAWTHPTTAADYTYDIGNIAPVERPAWVPSPEPGEIYTANFRVHVEETALWPTAAESEAS